MKAYFECPVCHSTLIHTRRIVHLQTGHIEVRDRFTCRADEKHANWKLDSKIGVLEWDMPNIRREFLNAHIARLERSLKGLVKEKHHEVRHTKKEKAVQHIDEGDGFDLDGGREPPGGAEPSPDLVTVS